MSPLLDFQFNLLSELMNLFPDSFMYSICGLLFKELCFSFLLPHVNNYTSQSQYCVGETQIHTHKKRHYCGVGWHSHNIQVSHKYETCAHKEKLHTNVKGNLKCVAPVQVHINCNMIIIISTNNVNYIFLLIVWLQQG